MGKSTSSIKSTKTEAFSSESNGRYWVEFFGMLLFVLLLAKLWNAMGLASLLPAGTSSVSLPAAFFVGLVAATGSCLALVGGLLLSVSAAWAEETQGMSTEKRLRPMTLFNVGRLAGYFVFGGLVGLLGMVLNPGGQITGYVTIILSFVMIALALRVLNLLPNALCRLPNDKWSKGLRSLSESRHPFMPFVLGALTFFVPCGFTQSMQLLALGTGSFFAGGMWMKDMLIPIDMIWIDSLGRVVHIEERVNPKTYPKVFQPEGVSAKYVLELPEGYVERNDVKEGDLMIWSKIQK
jgi:sulfite exporter TauE/SafE